MIPNQESTPRLVLASTSRYRAALLARLGRHWELASPGVDESHRAGEAPRDRALRLAIEKARAVAAEAPAAWVLGGDQVCACGARIFDKPGTLTNAHRQLRGLAGRRAEFHTAAALLRQRSGECYTAVDLTTVHFRPLTQAEIDTYLAAEPALDCAGSFKCEGLGISLFRSIDTHDPTALVGLPLIAVCRLLAQAGIAIP
ncbi:MAG TPA: nucleoside triphosphate pyrophosphatase [Nevskiaceae bacterium]|nr:nucleoside triphosphate pyrophosphatase [Nevskiaceae bacterium]